MIRGLKNLRHVRNSQQICLSSKYYSAKVNFIGEALENVAAYLSNKICFELVCQFMES